MRRKLNGKGPQTMTKRRSYLSQIVIAALIGVAAEIAIAQTTSVRPDVASETAAGENDLVYVDTSFENASPVWYEMIEGGAAIHLLYDHERNSPNRAAGHLHIRLETRPGSKLTLEIRNVDNIYNGRPGSVANEMHSLVVSEDGRSWRAVPTQVFEHHVRVQLSSPGKQLYVARIEPYRLSDLERLLDSIRRHPQVSIETIGQTVEGRDLELIRIGSPTAPNHAFVRARAHAWEAGSNWVVEGLIRRALRDDPQAVDFREQCCLWILPMANKDAVARGLTRFNLRGRDLNRDWGAPADPQTAPENHALEKWLEAKLNVGQRMHFALEVHNDGNGRLHLNSAPAADRPRYAERIKRFEDLLRQHTWFSVGTTQVMPGSGTLSNGWQNRYGIDGAVHEFNCQWIERLNEAPLAKHWLEYGAGLMLVFRDYFQ